MDKEALLNEITRILEDHLEGHLPNFVLIHTVSDLIDLFESFGSDFQKLRDCDGLTSWLLREALDDREDSPKYN